jgi:hypothetical protein
MMKTAVRKTIEKAVVVDSLRQEAGRQMRMFLDGVILRDQLIGAIFTLSTLESRWMDTTDSKELGNVFQELERQSENGVPLERTLSTVKKILESKSETFGGCY